MTGLKKRILTKVWDLNAQIQVLSRFIIDAQGVSALIEIGYSLSQGDCDS